MSNLSFSIGSIFFILVLIIVCIIKKVNRKTENKIYLILLITNFFGLLLDNVAFFLTITNHYHSLLYEWVTKIILCYYALWCILFTLYIIAVIYRKKDKMDNYKRVRNIFIFVVFPILVVINLIIPISFNNINNAVFPTGISIVLTYIIAVFSIIILVIFLIKNREHIKSKEFLPIVFLLIFSFISVIIQLIVPGLILITFVEALVTALMYFTIENPDVKLINELQVARDQAEKANRAKSDFLSSMSHEIRTPLNAIVGFSDYIMTSETLDEAKENAKDIINASQTLLEIVNSILDISKIESGKLEIANSKYNSQTTFEGLAKLITPKMKEKNLDFTYYIAPDIPETLYGDHANIKKIITNLLSNAYKYTDKGFVRYEVNCVNSNGYCKLIISVEDSGRGIKKESIDKLFTKFQRLEEDRNTTVEGTGLGLAITKQLVELMGGKILVHTIYGEGSKFTIVLNQKIEKFETEELAENTQEFTTLDLKDKKILLVDDNELNLKVANKILARYNATNVTSLNNGFDCLEKIKSGEKYDVILLDDMMPKLSGVEVLKELKNIPGFDQPVIVLTANAITGMKDKYIADGFNDYLAKPIEKEELIRVLNKVFLNNSKTKNEQLTEKESENIVEEELVKENLEEHINSFSEEYLKNNGVDLDKALETLGDIEMYNMTVKDFLTEVDYKWQKIMTYKENSDMVNYAIEVHSLKSDAKYLGLSKLADVAYEHELKSKENDVNFVNNNFEKLKEIYEKSIKVIKNYYNMVK